MILDPGLKLAIDMFACEDGYAQERALLSRVLATVMSRDLWIADRNFCTLGFLFGLHWRQACFVMLQYLAAQIDLAKFRSHPRGKKKKVPKPEYQKNRPHVSTVRLLAESKGSKKSP